MKRKAKKKSSRKTPRNALEQRNWDWLTAHKISFSYEPFPVSYSIEARYFPDFQLPNDILVETKGYFRVEDKRKMKSVKKCHPELDIRIVFDEPKSKSAERELAKNIRWCERQNFPYAVGLIPVEWFE